LGSAYRKLWNVQLDITARNPEAQLSTALAEKAERCLQVVYTGLSVDADSIALYLSCIEEQALLYYGLMQVIGAGLTNTTTDKDTLMSQAVNILDEAIAKAQEFGRSPSAVVPYLLGRLHEKCTPSRYQNFLPLYQQAVDLAHKANASANVRIEALYRLHASRVRLALTATLSSEDCHILAKYNFDTSKHKEETGNCILSGTAAAAEGASKIGDAKSSNAPCAAENIVENCLEALQQCHLQDPHHHKSVFCVANTLWVQYHANGEREKLVQARQELKQLFSKSRNTEGDFNIRMWRLGTKGGKTKCADPDDGIWSLHGRLFKLTRQKTRYLRVYAKMCVENTDYSSLSEAVQVVRRDPMMQHTHKEVLLACTKALTNAAASINPATSGELLYRIYSLVRTEEIHLKTMSIQSAMHAMLCQVFAAQAPCPASSKVTSLEDATLQPLSSSNTSVASCESNVGLPLLERVLAECEQRFQRKGAKKGPRGQAYANYVPRPSARRQRRGEADAEADEVVIEEDTAEDVVEEESCGEEQAGKIRVVYEEKINSELAACKAEAAGEVHDSREEAAELRKSAVEDNLTQETKSN